MCNGGVDSTRLAGCRVVRIITAIVRVVIVSICIGTVEMVTIAYSPLTGFIASATEIVGSGETLLVAVSVMTVVVKLHQKHDGCHVILAMTAVDGSTLNGSEHGYRSTVRTLTHETD